MKKIIIMILVTFGVLSVVVPVTAKIILNRMNPGSSFSEIRDEFRLKSLNKLGDLVEDYRDKHNKLPSEIPLVKTCIGSSPDCYDLKKHLMIEGYLPEDPEKGTERNINYFISKDVLGRVTFYASGEIQHNIKITR